MGWDTAQLCWGMLHIPGFSQQMGREGSGQPLPKAPARGTQEHLDHFPNSFGFPAAPDVPQMSGMKHELLSPCCGTQGLPVHPPVLPVHPSAQLGAGSSPMLSTAQFSSQKEGEIPPKAKYILKLWISWDDPSLWFFTGKSWKTGIFVLQVLFLRSTWILCCKKKALRTQNV